MKKNILLLAIITFVLSGCYEDKGNYDYKEVNDVLSLTFSPEPEISEYSYDYKYRQPPLDSLFVTYTPTIVQSHAEGNDNLEYQWIMSKRKDGKDVWDTLRTKDLTLKFPPKTTTSYSPLFRLIDHSTGIEYYRQFVMKTEVPFMLSWFVLHGDPGDRKLGIVEGINDVIDISITLDAYQEIWGIRRFEKAIGLLYSSQDGDFSLGPEHLTVLQVDSCAYMQPFNLLVTKQFEHMMLFERPRFAYGIEDETGDRTMIVDENGHCYWTKYFGYYFTVNTNEDSKDYITDKVFITGSGYATIWDKVHRQFFYYNYSENTGFFWEDPEVHPEDVEYNKAVLKPFEDDIFTTGEWATQEVLYLGQGNNELSKEGAIVIGVDTTSYTAYQIGYDVKGSSFISINKVKLANLILDENSQFATSIAYTDQIFFTRNSAVYLYNMVSGEETFLYDAGGVISKLQFRIARTYEKGYQAINANSRLGIVVNRTDGTGELHEIFLDGAGDVENILVYSGFGPIQDIVFSSPGIRRY